MRPPPGFPTKVPGHVLELHKGLYGLKQSAMLWNSTWDTAVKDLGYRQLSSDECVYIRKSSGGDTEIIGLHVDDGLTMSSGKRGTDPVIDEIEKIFNIKRLGGVKRYCGLEIERNLKSGVLTVGQKGFIEKMLEDAGMHDSKPVRTPMSPGLQLPKLDSPSINLSTYQSLVGSLMWLACGTRPDIAYATCYLARFLNAPGPEHLAAVKRVLRYVRGTSDLKLCFHSDSSDPLIRCYVDADWASDNNTRKSTSGIVCLLYGTPVYWSSRKQKIVTLSSTESEYVAASSATQELIWYRQLLIELGIPLNSSIPLLVDNQSAIALASSHKTNARTKHIDVRYHFIREKVEDGTIALEYVPTDEQLADVMTKSLGLVKHADFVKSLQLV